MPSGEVKIQLDDNNKYDIDFDEDSGDLIQDEGLETAILMSILLNARASEEQIPQPFKRGGYWAADITGMNFSHLWLVNGRRTQDKLNLGIEYCNEALSWLIEKQYATLVKTEASYISEGIQLDIAITKPNGIIDNYTYNLWINTDF